MKSIKRILIINRGEIAARIAKTCKKLNLEPLIVYSAADRETLAVQEATETYYLGLAPVSDSYLNSDKILRLAKDVKADAIHPGYGLLSENSEFASQVIQAGLVWIGPSPESMNLLSSKSRAKQLAESVGVPLLPSYYLKPESSLSEKEALEAFVQAAEKMGYPVLLKASAGGGGRGIRRVNSSEELRSQYAIASTEAAKAFGSGELLVEKYLPEAYHIEIQVFGDHRGEVVHLGERDCSTQRRHQKLIEESPSPALSVSLRQQITESAVKLLKASKYSNAGTVEFLLSPDGNYYFLEVNTRLQVEHPVTEMITGLDLVEWQLRIAQGESLPLKQEQICFSGHSIQARIYAEDPYDNYRPQTGRIEGFYFPQSSRSSSIRVDHFLTSRTEITSYYDSMLAKLIVNKPRREDAIQELKSALAQTLIVGPKTNRLFLQQIIESDFFVQGRTFSQTLDQTTFTEAPLPHPDKAAAWACLFEYLQSLESLKNVSSVSAWSNNHYYNPTLKLVFKDQPLSFQIHAHSEGYALLSENLTLDVRNPKIETHAEISKLQFEFENTHQTVLLFKSSSLIEVLWQRYQYSFTNPLIPALSKGGPEDLNTVYAPLAGTITQLKVSAGDKVTSGDLLVIIEAMKMQFELKAPRDGFIEKIEISPNTQVKNRQILLTLKAQE